MLFGCVAGAVYLTGQLWVDPNRRVVSHNAGDQALFEWLLGYAAHATTHLADPFWTTLLNVPTGVNLAVNTSTVVIGALLTPITLTLGAPLAFLGVLTLNLVLTPYAWYHVLSRHVTRTRAGAVLGGLFCGFAPGMVSHANGHLNFTGQFLVPFLVRGVLTLGRSGRPVRHGALLGVLVAVSFSISAELLFLVALACGLFVLLWSALHRAAARSMAPTFLRGLASTGAVALALLAYPLYLQFLGPQRYHGIGFDQSVHSEDLAAPGAVPYLSLGRLAGLWTRLAPNYTEETTFFGAPLLMLSAVCLVLLWRRPVVRALAGTGLVFAVLALGPRLHVAGRVTPIPLPYRLLAELPIFNTALPARLDLMLIPIIAVLLALALDRALALPSRWRRAWLIGFTVALLPIVPVPMPASPRDPVPVFFTDGTWRRYLPAGRTLVPVPPASDLSPDGQRWQSAARFGFAIPAGFFLGPGGPDGRSRIGPPPRPSYALLDRVAQQGSRPVLTGRDRARARADLAYWHAGLIVLADGGAGSRWTGNRDQLLAVATELFGPPRRVEDVWLWQVGQPTVLASR